MIDYSWRTEETEPDFQRVLRLDALKFLAWRAKGERRKAQPLERAFRTWWLLHGRTGFRTTEDSLRFRNELLQFAVGLKDELQ